MADLRALLAAQGMQLHADDRQAAQQLVRLHQEYARQQQYAPYVNSYMQHQQAFSEWMRGQQQGQQSRQPAQAQQPQTWYSGSWNPPEYNPAWEQLITKDAMGNLVPVQGAPPDVVPKYLAHLQHQREFAQKFWQNPYGTMEEPIRNLIREEAQKIAAGQLDRYQEVQSAKAFTQENDAWLFQRGPDGRPQQTLVWNPTTGRQETQAVLSVWGQKLRDYALEEAQYQQTRGIYDPERQKQVAMQKVEREAAIYRLQQIQQAQQPPQTWAGARQAAQSAPAAPAQSPLEQANQAFTMRYSNAAPGQRGSGGNSVTAPTPDGRFNIEQELKAALAAAGNPPPI